MVTADEFEGDYRVVAERCLDYWSREKEAPKVHMPDILSDIMDDPKNPRVKTFKHILIGLIDLYDAGINAKFVLDRLYKYKRGIQLKKAILVTAEKLASQRELALEEVEEYLHDVLRKQPIGFDAGRTLEEYDVVLDYLENNFSEFTTGIDELDKAQVVPYRGALYLLIAVKGHGKTWWLVNLGKRAFQQNKKVVHITLEMSVEETMLRYYQCLWSISQTKEERTGKAPDFILEQDDHGHDTLVDLVEANVVANTTFDNPNIGGELSSRISGWAKRSHNIRIQRFPPYSLTPDGVRAYLDNLEIMEGFIPDLLIVDYAGIMKTDPKNQRIDIGRNVAELRAIGIERNMAVATVHQSTRKGAESSDVRAIHASEDWSVVHTADTILTFSASEVEKALGLGRIYVEHNRNRRDHWGVILSQALHVGQFVRQSAPFNPDYWDLLKVHEERGDEESKSDGGKVKGKKEVL